MAGSDIFRFGITQGARVFYFKMFTEARNDAKLRSLDDAQFRAWFNLLCLAAESETPGTIRTDSERLLALEVAGGDAALLRSTLAALSELHIIEVVAEGETRETPEPFHLVSPVSSRFTAFQERFIRFIAFDRRQSNGAPSKGKTSTDRVRKHRAAKRLRQQDDPAPVDTDMPKRHETETVSETHETPNRVEKSREENSSAPLAGAREDGEPFVSPGTVPEPGPDPDVTNDPGEVRKVAAKAEDLFPMAELGRKVRESARVWPMAWVSLALEEAHAAGVADWRYVLGILRRWRGQGGPDAAPAPRVAGRVGAGTGKPKPSFAEQEEIVRRNLGL